MTKVRPMFDRVLVKPDPVKETDGAIALPKLSKSASTTGTVLAVGPGRTDDRGRTVGMTIGVGDRVMFKERAGWEIDDGVLMCEMDIVAVVG